MDALTTQWRKSSYSSANGGECVELARTSDAILIRDSKDPTGGHLTLPASTFRAFLSGIKDGQYDT